MTKTRFLAVFLLIALYALVFFGFYSMIWQVEIWQKIKTPLLILLGFCYLCVSVYRCGVDYRRDQDSFDTEGVNLRY